MHIKYLIFILSFSLFHSIYASGLEVNLRDICEDLVDGQTHYVNEEGVSIKLSLEALIKLQNFCRSMKGKENDLASYYNGYQSKLSNPKDSPWEVRLFFGFARTHYWSTDVSMNIPEVGSVTLKNFDFTERTSAGFYNPKNWEKLEDAFRWIDEPTNRIELTLQKNRDVIYLSYFHPKYFFDNVGQDITFSSLGSENRQGTFEEATGAASISSTFGNADISLGYGRQQQLLGKKPMNGLFITPRFAAGVGLNKFRVTYGDGTVLENKFRADSFTLQGGARVEYKNQKWGLFIDHSIIRRWANHQIDDISVKYQLNYVSTSFGISYGLFKIQKRKK